MPTTFTDRLAQARERLGIALDPAERATRAGREPGAAFAQVTGPDPYAGEPAGFRPAGMIANPVATNFGRLAQARTDVPRFIAPEDMPAGVSPGDAAARAGGIDVRSYVGSRYAQPQAQTMGLGPDGQPSRSPLPVGNPSARDAILRSSFPQASRSELFSLGAMAYNRPDEFNAATGGKFDPAVARARAGMDAAKDALDLASKAQSMRLGGEQAAVSMATQMQGADISAEEASRRAQGDMAAQSYFANSDDPEIATLARNGAPSAQLFDLANLARQRAQDAAAAAAKVPTQTSFYGRPAVVTNGNVQFADRPEPRPGSPTNFAKLRAERAALLAAGDTAGVAEYDKLIAMETQPRPTTLETMMAFSAAQGRPAAAPVTPRPTPAAAGNPPNSLEAIRAEQARRKQAAAAK
jgi:hypothetical protein